jgi:hypothetical protein
MDVSKDMAGDDRVLKDKTVTCFSHADDVVGGPDIAEVRAVNKVCEIASICWRAWAGAFLDIDGRASDDADNMPWGLFSGGWSG